MEPKNVIRIEFNAPIIKEVNICSELDLKKVKEELSLVLANSIDKAVKITLIESE